MRDLVGQSLMLQLPGPEPTDEARAALRRVRPCGVMLLARNIRSRAGIHRLCSELQAEARALGMPPLLFAADQEGGNVSRLPAEFVTVPSPMAQAATGDPEAARVCARASGRQLREVGIAWAFAPVLDVNVDPANPVIGARSFGDDPGRVTAFGLAALAGWREAGVVATAKHFPGHGDTDVDSHHGLPTVRHGHDRLRAVELAPFAAAIRAGMPAVMTAHVVFPALDDRPATLSRRVLTGLLREELGFGGVVVTDAMDMRAVSGTYGVGEAAVLAKAAGADVLEMVASLDDQFAAAAALREAASSGRLPDAMFAATARRLDALRAEYGLTHEVPPLGPPDLGPEGTALDVARRSVTLLGDPGVLPFGAGTRLAVFDGALARWSPAEEVGRVDTLRAFLAERFPQAVVTGYDPAAPPDPDALARAARDADAILFVTRNAGADGPEARLGRALVGTGVPVVHVAARGPYDAGLVPGAAATLLTYGDPPVSLRALIETVAGDRRAAGTLPVTLRSRTETFVA